MTESKRHRTSRQAGATRRLLAISLLALAAAGLASGARASGGGATAAPPPAAAPEDPKIVAARHYNAAVQLRERADRLRAELPTIEDEKKRAKTEKKIEASYESAERELRQAVRLNPRFFEAFSDLGYALRKQGQYEQALGAYDTALGLSPGYAPAIEYRAEAYLGLGRVEEAKAAYMTLFERDRARADELLAAMKAWVASRQADPGAVSQAAIEDLAAWVASRDSVAQQVPPVGAQQARGWGQ